MEKHFAFSDEPLPPEPIIALPSTQKVCLTEAHRLFQYDRYDWDGFDPDYGVIRLTRGYFAIVSKSDYKKVSKLKWCANVQLSKGMDQITKVYAVRRHKNEKTGKWEYMYLHRFIAQAGGRVVVDHLFGMTLDCRRNALKATDLFGNAANARGNRTKNHNLKRGVSFSKDGKSYVAQIEIRQKIHHSKKKWPLTPEGEEAAHQWYLGMHKKAHSHRGLAELGGKASYPVFPPLKQVRTSRRRRHSVQEPVHDIPF